MYLKRFRRRASGRDLTYLALAHNVWETRPDGRRQARPLLLMSLGPEHEADPRYLKDLVTMTQALFEARVANGMSPTEAAHDVARSFAPMQKLAGRVVQSKKLGMRLLLAPVWQELGLHGALKDFAKAHRLRAFDLERLLFGLVTNRIVDPMSKRAANEWIQDDAYFPEAEGWEVQHYYRALDLLHEHWEDLEVRLFQSLWDRATEDERRLWLIDTTSMYFEASIDDEERAELAAEWAAYDAGEREKSPRRPRPQVINEPVLRMHGHNKDGHSGDPQVVVASVCLPNGVVIRHKTYPGNTADVTIAGDLVAALPSPDPETARLWVSDGGMISSSLQARLDGQGWFRLTAESLRKSSFARSHVLPIVGRYQSHPTKERYTFKTVMVSADDSPSGRAETWVVVRNAWDRERQLRQIAEHVERVREALAKKEPEGSHSKSVCAVATHPVLKRYVKPSEKVPGRYVLDQEAIRREEQFAGTRLLRTTLTEMAGYEVFDAYQLLQVVERNHREYKGPLQLRPCYHRSGERIRAHVMLTILAANCVRMLEARTGESIADLRKRFERVQASQVSVGGRLKWTCSEISAADRQVLRRAGVGEIPPFWRVWRDPIAARKPVSRHVLSPPKLRKCRTRARVFNRRPQSSTLIHKTRSFTGEIKLLPKRTEDYLLKSFFTTALLLFSLVGCAQPGGEAPKDNQSPTPSPSPVHLVNASLCDISVPATASIGSSIEATISIFFPSPCAKLDHVTVEWATDSARISVVVNDAQNCIGEVGGCKDATISLTAMSTGSITLMDATPNLARAPQATASLYVM